MGKFSYVTELAVIIAFCGIGLVIFFVTIVLMCLIGLCYPK